MMYDGLSLSLCFLVTYIESGWIILFIGNLSLSDDDLVQYCIVTSSLLSFSGGRLHSTSRLSLEVALYDPIRCAWLRFDLYLVGLIVCCLLMHMLAVHIRVLFAL